MCDTDTTVVPVQHTVVTKGGSWGGHVGHKSANHQENLIGPHGYFVPTGRQNNTNKNTMVCILYLGKGEATSEFC